MRTWVPGRAKVDRALAEAGARAVFDTLREAVSAGEYDQVVAQLPTELSQVAGPVPPFDGQGGRR
ncbi:DUF2267 domain-containing protein [Micromonospora sp. NPDC005299]|uniref:DUF2267 domain-containing protein n=1 Tax=Micromonospora sp. NPDC005299 TaxID=3364231 RepID=UPI00369102F0